MRTKNPEAIPVIEGFEAELKTINILTANLVSIPFLVLVGGVAGCVYYSVWHTFELESVANALWLAVAIAAGIVVHELIHGFTWMLVTKQSFKHLSFGTMAGAVYCHIDVPMSKRHYLVGAVMPLLLLGLVPTVVAVAVGSVFWLVFGVIFIVSAIGDILIMWALRGEPSDALVYDHPTAAGCVVYRRVCTETSEG